MLNKIHGKESVQLIQVLLYIKILKETYIITTEI